MSRGIKVSASGFGDAFEGIFDDFFDHVGKDAKAAVQAGGNACRQQLQGTTVPGDTGGYAGGWRMRTEHSRFGGYYVRIYNTSKPSLTHLLENGHAKWVHGVDTGERVPAYKHIEPAYEAGCEVTLKELSR